MFHVQVLRNKTDKVPASHCAKKDDDEINPIVGSERRVQKKQGWIESEEGVIFKTEWYLKFYRIYILLDTFQN